MPTSHPSLEDVFRPRGILATRMDGYEHRPSQLEMAQAVEDAIANRHHLAVEAGTGTGKTLAYLIPSLFSVKRVIVSTATRTLQDQLIHSDLPFLKKHLAPNLAVACMKGRNNYLCLRRLRQELGKGYLLAEERRKLARLASWSDSTPTGERSEIDWLADSDPLWHSLDARSDICTGQACDDFAHCFITRMRQEAFEADLLVVNHALFFANLAMESDEIGKILPDHGVLILDEAHRVEDIVAHHFGSHLSNYRFEDLVGDLQRAFAGQEAPLPVFDRLQQEARRLFAAFPGEEDRYSLNFFPSAHGAIDLRDELGPAYTRLRSTLRLLYSELQLVRPRPDEWEALVRRVEQLTEDLDSIFTRDSYENVYWFEKRQGGIFVHMTPINVADLLYQKLFDRTDTVILTSATLTTGGSFQYLRQRLGIPEPVELTLESEFDYEQQAILFIARSLPQPGSPQFLARALPVVEELVNITQGHTFVLCTSIRNMNQFYAALSETVPYPVFRQGDMPRHRLLQEFKTTPNAVLCATVSFWEGVDVKGAALRAVIVDKLPFQVPTEPVVAARLHRIREMGGDPFLDYTVPEAIISLKQGLGRLIRSRTDSGILAILDSRISTRRYGELFMQSLPKCRVTDNMDSLRNFFRQTTSRVSGGEPL